MSGAPGQHPGRWIVTLMRGGDLYRAKAVAPGKTTGKCREPGCDWPGPYGDNPHNIGRSLFRHTRKAGHVTRMITVELTEYRPRRREPSGRPENPS